jgi:hypothetical protein
MFIKVRTKNTQNNSDSLRRIIIQAAFERKNSKAKEFTKAIRICILLGPSPAKGNEFISKHRQKPIVKLPLDIKARLIQEWINPSTSFINVRLEASF